MHAETQLSLHLILLIGLEVEIYRDQHIYPTSLTFLQVHPNAKGCTQSCYRHTQSRSMPKGCMRYKNTRIAMRLHLNWDGPYLYIYKSGTDRSKHTLAVCYIMLTKLSDLSQQTKPCESQSVHSSSATLGAPGEAALALLTELHHIPPDDGCI